MRIWSMFFFNAEPFLFLLSTEPFLDIIHNLGMVGICINAFPCNPLKLHLFVHNLILCVIIH